MDFSNDAIWCRNIALLDFAVFTDVYFINNTLNGTGLGDCLGADDAHICIHHSLEVSGIFKGQDVFTVGDGYSVMADGDYGIIGKELYSTIPVFILNGKSCNLAVSGINEQSFAHAQLTALGNADNGKTENFYTFFHEYSS